MVTLNSDAALQAELVFRPFEAGCELKNQRSLFRDCFPETIGQPGERGEHYFWKFHGFPSRPPSYEYGAYLGDELIGYYGAIPYKYKIGGQLRTAAMVCDVMTSSRARGQGVFTRLGAYSLGQLKSAGLDFTTGYPIRPEVLPGHLKIGWKVVQKMPIYLKVLKTDSILKLKKLGFLSFLGNAGAAVFNLIPNIRPAGKEYALEVLSVEEILNDETYLPFFQKWMTGVPNALIKDRDFLKWRFGAPETEYGAFVARNTAREIVAMCIARNAILEKIPTLALLDLMILPGHHRSFRLIERALRRHASRSGSEVIATMIHPSWARKYGLRGMGYLRTSFVFSFIVKKFNDFLDDSMLQEADQWHTMWIDSDDL